FAIEGRRRHAPRLIGANRTPRRQWKGVNFVEKLSRPVRVHPTSVVDRYVSRLRAAPSAAQLRSRSLRLFRVCSRLPSLSGICRLKPTRAGTFLTPMEPSERRRDIRAHASPPVEIVRIGSS